MQATHLGRQLKQGRQACSGVLSKQDSSRGLLDEMHLQRVMLLKRRCTADHVYVRHKRMPIELCSPAARSTTLAACALLQAKAAMPMTTAARRPREIIVDLKSHQNVCLCGESHELADFTCVAGQVTPCHMIVIQSLRQPTGNEYRHDRAYERTSNASVASDDPKHAIQVGSRRHVKCKMNR